MGEIGQHFVKVRGAIKKKMMKIVVKKGRERQSVSSDPFLHFF